MSDLTPDQMYQFFTAGALGTKEFRSWLAKYDENFAEVRDPDVDNEIDRVARQRREALENGPGLQLVDREGNLRSTE